MTGGAARRLFFMARLVYVLCVAAWLTAPATPAAAAEREHLSQDPQVNHARALIHAGQHSRALEILRPLARRARADITDIRFLIGVSAIAGSHTADADARSALLSEAIAALRAILIDHPGLTRVRLELARAFFLKGDDELSREHFERVLAGKPPAAMASNIRRFLHAIRARRDWSGYLTLGLEQNDNINNGADTEVIELFGLPFVVNEQSRRRAQTGVSVAAGVERQFPLGERRRWLLGIDTTRGDYEGHAFDQTYLRVRGGVRWLWSRGGELSLQAIGAQRELARDRHSVDAGLLLNARHRLSARLGVNARAARTQTRHRRTSSADHSDRDYRLGATYLFSPLLQGDAHIGVGSERFKSGIRHRSRHAGIGLSVILPSGWTLGGRLERWRQRHGENAPFSADRRVDRRRIARLFLLNRGLTFYGFSPQLLVTRERQKSNSTLDNYRRTRVDLRFVRQF